MSYDITIREVWYKSATGNPVSKWDWVVTDEISIIAEGSAPYSAFDARKQAEKAATLHARQMSAKVETYEFTPE